MSHRGPETASIIFLTSGRCGWKCTDLPLISDTATVKCSAQKDKVQEKTEKFVSHNSQKKAELSFYVVS